MPDFVAMYRQLCDHLRRTSLLATTASVLDWDQHTKMPTGADAHRAEQAALLAGLVHEQATAPCLGEWLAELRQSPLAADAASDTAVTLRQVQRSYDRNTKLPQDLVEELTRTASLAHQVWVEARRENNFGKFVPLLTRMVELKRQEADAVGWRECRYDALLDEYEPHATAREVGLVLHDLRSKLVPLVEAIVASPTQPDVSILSREFPIAAQQQLGEQVARAVGFDFEAGRIDTSAHPFCTTLGPRDIRLTTRYDDHDLGGALFSTLHEVGHGLYEQGLPASEFGLPLGETVSLGIHESQSRMWENLVGRSRSYWKHYYPKLQQTFAASLGSVPMEAFYFAVNSARPSLIRTEADEVTYNLHIVVRFELEQQLLDGALPVADLPDAWNQRYREYLGIDVPTDTQGVLQDVHWCEGLFGYFPTYALGNLYAAQFFDSARQELGDLDGQLSRGEFAPLLAWLRHNIHQHGQRYTAAELVQHVTGHPLDSAHLLAHLRAKYGELYRL